MFDGFMPTLLTKSALTKKTTGFTFIGTLSFSHYMKCLYSTIY